VDAPQVAVILKALNVTATMEWYQLIGFEVRASFPESEPTWVELARDGLVVQFLCGDTPWPAPPTLTGCLYVHPGSVQAVHDQIKDRVPCPLGVEERPWGARELTVADPDGYFLTFTEPIEGDGEADDGAAS
jgi:hypothetical protein